MKIRTFAMMVITLALAGAAAAQAQQTTPLTPKHRITGSYYWLVKPQDPKPEPKPEPKVEMKVPTAASLADKWTLSVDANGSTMEVALDLKADPKDAKKVGGTITSPQGEAAIEGEVVGGKLTFWFTMNGGGGEMSVTFVGAVQKDGSMAGTLSFGQGDMNWTGVRVKK